MNEHDLDAIEQRLKAVTSIPWGREGFVIEASLADIPALIAALRAALAERNDWKERFVGDAGRWGVSYGELVRDAATLEAERDRYRAALVGLVGCIDQSAANNGPPVTRGSMTAQVCKVLQRTLQYEAARAALTPPDAVVHRCPPEGSGLMPCCGRTPFDVARTDRMTIDPALVTCSTPVEPGASAGASS